MIGATAMIDILRMEKSVASNHELILAGDRCQTMSNEFAKRYKACPGDERLLRARLLLEELGELLLAMAASDEVQMVDAIADLAYVTIGTAVTFDLPFAPALAEAHRSNLTKDSHVDHAAGIKGKGESFSQPDFQAVLIAHRMGKYQ